jgi:hypothetical protein
MSDQRPTTALDAETLRSLLSMMTPEERETHATRQAAMLGANIDAIRAEAKRTLADCDLAEFLNAVEARIRPTAAMLRPPPSEVELLAKNFAAAAHQQAGARIAALEKEATKEK